MRCRVRAKDKDKGSFRTMEMACQLGEQWLLIEACPWRPHNNNSNSKGSTVEVCKDNKAPRWVWEAAWEWAWEWECKVLVRVWVVRGRGTVRAKVRGRGRPPWE